MSDELSQVRQAMQDIFDYMQSNRTNEIANFALVEFNDPNARLKTITTNSAEYRKQLGTIRVDGGGDCPEMAMEGIKIALEKSLPHSYIFVFTDASAKDYYKKAQVEDLIQRKKSKVIFVLTGKCGSESDPGYQAYHSIARVANGHVFNLLKNEVKKVLEFVKLDASKKGVVSSGELPDHKRKEIQTPVDGSMTELTVTVTGKKPIVNLKDPTGKRSEGKTILDLDSVKAKQVKNPIPGNWTVEVGATSPGRFVITAESSFNFIYGFSLKPTNNMKETAPRPLIGTENSLLIQVTNHTNLIHLISVKIKDTKDNVLKTMTLSPVPGKSGTYLAHKFHPPTFIFLLEVTGKDSKNNDIVRISDSGITPQQPAPPRITLQKNLTATLKSPFTLACHVESLVPFTASWFKGSTNVLPEESFMQTSQVPYKISNTSVSSGGEYNCTAKNIAGVASQTTSLFVQVPPPSVKTPKVVQLLANSTEEIPCQVESDVDYTVSWTRKDESGSLLSINDGRFIVKPSGPLTISSIQKIDEGEYHCTAKSIFGAGESTVFLEVIEPVLLSAVTNKNKFKADDYIQLLCTVSGSLPIDIVWKKNGIIIQSDHNRLIEHENNYQLYLILYNAQMSDEGIYACEATNRVNTESGTVELKYLEIPTVKMKSPLPPALVGMKYTFNCLATGHPQPIISWTRNGKDIRSGEHEKVLPNGTLIIPELHLSQSGVYQCIAENEMGRADAEGNIDVGSIPQFSSENEEIDVEINKNGIIPCNVKGHPTPKITWQSRDGKELSKRFSPGVSCSMHLTGAQLEDEGTYIVTAVNKFGLRKKEIKINISGLVKPILSNGESEEVSHVGKHHELHCSVLEGNPPPTITWYKDGEQLDSSELSLMEGGIHENGTLTFSYVKPDNEGTYECEASNIAGNARRKVDLKVHEAPGFTDNQHLVLKVRPGNAISLPCVAYGNPKPRIVWMKDNKHLTGTPSIAYNTKDDSLSITRITLENNGTYECIATNSAGRNIKVIDLLVQDAPRIFPQSEQIYAERGEEITLQCEVIAFPSAEIKWLKDDIPFETASISYSENKSFIRMKADLLDSGEYTCVAVNEAGHDKMRINVTVSVAPFFENTEEYIQVSRGDNVTLSCHTDAFPPPDYYWMKYPDTEQTLADSMVTFYNVDDDFGGLHRCDVMNFAGYAQKVFIVTVYAPPRIIADLPESQFLRKGIQFEIPCFADGEPTPKIRWLRNGEPLPKVEEEGLLSINSVTQDDAGLYTCVAENYEGSDEKNMEIIVEAPPEMDLFYPSVIEVNETDTVTIACPAISGVPSPTVRWLKDEETINPTRRISPSQKDQYRSLKLKRVRDSDSGVYSCVASNSAGQARADVPLHVLIAPQFLNGKSEENVDKLRGTTVELNCSNSGKPAAKVSWYRNAHPLIPSVSPHAEMVSNDQVLRILKTTNADQAVYKCVVENKAGRIERTFHVKLFVHSKEEGVDIAEEVEGKWGPWSPWSECSASCGKSEQARTRKCDNEDARCPGEAEQWRECFVGGCKVDGEWGKWGNWSACSVTCGVGKRFRERHCNNPPPSNGGAICFGSNRQHESCNTVPCPVDGSWSEWSNWLSCGGPCSNSETKRIRKCTNPAPAFGGRNCSGLNVEYKPCKREDCPVDGGWSEWSPWSSCSATCGASSSFRERSCDNPKPKLNGANCEGDRRETQKCDSAPCDQIPLSASVQVVGSLNGHIINGTLAHVNISDLTGERLVEVGAKNPFKQTVSAGWYPYLSLVISPVTWLTAFPINKAVNGYTLTKGIFQMETVVIFKTGQSVLIKHRGFGIGSDGKLKLRVDIQGESPLFPSRSQAKMEPYEEDYIQTGPGELFVTSTNTLEGGGISVPLSWNKTIIYDATLGQQPTLVQTLTVQNIKARRIRHKEEGSIKSKADATCPAGLRFSDSYCEDINECSDRRMNNCHYTQACANLKGSYTCTCPPGFKASTKGGQCIDINECAQKPSMCSHKCENLEGSFKCLCPPGLALLESKTTCSSILPKRRTELGDIDDWKHCLPKQIEVDGMCKDEDPCKDSLHMCKEDEVCLNVRGLYNCLPVPCPHEYQRIRNSKNCIKNCSITVCDSGAKLSETVTPVILTLNGPIAPHKDLTRLPPTTESYDLLHTFYRIIENEAGKPFRITAVNGIGTIYSTQFLPARNNYRVTVQATTYDDTETDILHVNKFDVAIYTPDDEL